MQIEWATVSNCAVDPSAVVVLLSPVLLLFSFLSLFHWTPQRQGSEWKQLCFCSSVWTGAFEAFTASGWHCWGCVGVCGRVCAFWGAGSAGAPELWRGCVRAWWRWWASEAFQRSVCASSSGFARTAAPWGDRTTPGHARKSTGLWDPREGRKEGGRETERGREGEVRWRKWGREGRRQREGEKGKWDGESEV